MAAVGPRGDVHHRRAPVAVRTGFPRSHRRGCDAPGVRRRRSRYRPDCGSKRASRRCRRRAREPVQWRPMPPKPRQIRIEQRGAVQALQALEQRSDEELEAETKFRSEAHAILGARAAERFDPERARGHFQRAIAAARPQERMQIRRMSDVYLAQAERRAGDLQGGGRAPRANPSHAQAAARAALHGTPRAARERRDTRAHSRRAADHPGRDRTARAGARHCRADRAAVRRSWPRSRRPARLLPRARGGLGARLVGRRRRDRAQAESREPA